jgi:hypothetical protein
MILGFAHTPGSFKGRLAEWLGRGLQNLSRRFESAIDLFKKVTLLI